MQLNLNVTPVFEANYDAAEKVVVNRGGTRSSKTVSLMQLAVLFLMTGYVRPGVKVKSGTWSTVRKFSASLDKTVVRDFENELTKHNLWDAVTRSKATKTYAYQDRMVEFIGADDQQKLRGAKRSVLHCNEGNELQWADWQQLIFRTEERAYIDFNPDDENIWIHTEIEQRRAHDKGDVKVIVSNYQDNTFLPQSLVSEIEYLQKTDAGFWKIFGLGQYGSIKGLVFDNWTVAALPDEARLLGYGQDFGYTNDPSALVAVYRYQGQLWFQEQLYQTRLTNQDLSRRYQDLGLAKSAIIVADSAEPKSIEELYRKGWNVHAAKKGPDSIKNSIDILKRYVCHITPQSVNLIKERKTYKWKQDKEGHYMNEPVDYNNHLIDAIRYFALNQLTDNRVQAPRLSFGKKTSSN